jgi:hypothetical protein
LRAWAVATVMILAAGAWCGARAATITSVVTFSEQDLTVTRVGGYDVVRLPDCDSSDEIGCPSLPVCPLSLALPAGSRVERLDVVSAESRELVQRILPLPAQRPRILGTPAFAPPPWSFAEPDERVYRGSEAYPARIAEVSSIGRLAGNTVVGVLVHPVQYVPEAGKLRFFKRIEIQVTYEPGAGVMGLGPPREALARAASTIVRNGSEIKTPGPRPASRGSRLEPGDYEYVVITDAGYVASFQPLVEWKTRKGVPATTVTVAWIDASYEGPDTQARIRSFIADAYETWGATWFLLGGDTQVIPARLAYAMTSEAGGDPDEDSIPCDLYFSDLDGSWDADGDGIYGETTDGVDLYPDVFVGRFPARTNADVRAFVSKVLAYERGGVGDHREMVMAGEVLWTDPFTDAGAGLNVIDRESIPPRYDPITKLYETLGNESVASVVDALNAGPGHFLHAGHAWCGVLGCGDGYLDRPRVDALTNGLSCPLVYSIGCWPAAFDRDENCIAEQFVKNANGGAVAFIGNSRYGWGAPGNPGYGYSERFMQRFYATVFRDGLSRAGAALAAAKAAYVPFSEGENVYRWHQYEVNLLGDPEMPLRTDDPAALSVTCPDSMTAGASVFDVSVWKADGPVAGALVCVTNGEDVYARARTGANGGASIPIETSLAESLDVTVTAQDCLPFEDRVAVRATGPYLRPGGYVIEDGATGNGDALAGPGERVALELALANLGTEEASDVVATIASDDPRVTVESASAVYGDVQAGSSAEAEGPFVLVIGGSCANGDVIPLDVEITSDGGHAVWRASVGLTVSAPVVEVDSYSIDDESGGDGDGILEPGETARLMFQLRNGGLAPARSPEVSLGTSEEFLSTSVDPVSIGDLGPGETEGAVFDVAVDPACPVPCFPTLEISMAPVGAPVTSAPVVVAVGSAGLSDGFENGAAGWTHEGANDLWNLTDRRARSGEKSWYCGASGTWEYADDMDCFLVSPPLVLGAVSELTFWCWYELPIYHQDGLYVELWTAAGLDTLDFIGSGGALERLGSIGNDWLEHRYPLEGAPGETARIVFRFVSDDSEVREGFYIDDVAVASGAEPSAPGGADEPAQGESPIVLFQNRPNPFAPRTSIGFELRQGGHITLAVYNIQGRLIRVLADTWLGPGEHAVEWDGRDDLGADVAAGVYMYRLSLADHEDSRKMILIR